jgi:flagellar biosynthetic protein FlhB
MTKQEVKDEYKQTEGDPQIKGRIREKQRKMSMNRMIQQVPNADVVVRNPTHFAVALKYDIDTTRPRSFWRKARISWPNGLSAWLRNTRS